MTTYRDVHNDGWRRTLADKLTDMFIEYQYRLDNPMPKAGESFDTYITEYRNDHIFHAKVASLVAGVMNACTKVIGESDEQLP